MGKAHTSSGKVPSAVGQVGSAPGAALPTRTAAVDRSSELARLALLSRLLVLSLGIAFNQVVSDYDSSTARLRQGRGGNSGNSSGDWAMAHSLDAFAHWDAVYFLRVAEFGYE